MAEEKITIGENIEEGLSKAQTFIDRNKNAVMIAGGVVLVLVVGLIYLFQSYLPAQNEKAQKAMYMAEFAFAKDSFALALNGQSLGANPYKGFASVAKEYSWTKAGKLANYYAGICCLNLKKYDNAIKYLESFNTSDPILGAVRLGAIGDAYMELNKADEGLKYYEKAADFSDNEVYTPYFLLKTGMAYERFKKTEEAKKFYEKVKDEYPKSEEAQRVEAYIARLTAQ
jgi:tetratricopeptide (TPR) repeat protein